VGFLGKLTGGGVDWTLQLEVPAAVYRPGEAVRGAVSLTPQRDIDTRALVISLIGTEQYRYVERVNSGGHVGSEDRVETDELARQDVPLGGAARLSAGQSISVPFQLVVPHAAPPSFQTRTLECTWKLEAKLDVGGRDPSVERLVTILQPASALMASPGGVAVAPRSEGSRDGAPFAIWLEPVPLLLGAPFRGTIDLARPLEGDDVRMELNVEVEAGGGFGTGASLAVAAVLGTGRDNASETVAVWRGTVTPGGAGAGWYRYTFSGTLPAQLVPTVELPHGRARASLQLVVSRRLRPDTRYAREVALATAW
jgi:hypothetical protein